MSPQLLSRTATLNDMFRTTFIGGHVTITPGIRALGQSFESACVEAVQTFKAFTPDNDPYGEHDCAAMIVRGQRVLWKIDYYDPTMRYGFENPADAVLTRRVLTIMLAEEY